MNVYAQIAIKIIASQEAIIGPVAIEQAAQIPHLQVDWSKHSVAITGDESSVIDQLVDRYRDLFGQISVEVSKQAVEALLPQLSGDKLPTALK